jgi:hypothetical protein
VSPLFLSVGSGQVCKPIILITISGPNCGDFCPSIYNYVHIRLSCKLIASNSMPYIPLKLESRNLTSYVRGPRFDVLPTAYSSIVGLCFFLTCRSQSLNSVWPRTSTFPHRPSRLYGQDSQFTSVGPGFKFSPVSRLTRRTWWFLTPTPSQGS